MESTQLVPSCSFKCMKHPEHKTITAELEQWVMDLVAPRTAAAAQYWKDQKFPVLGSCLFAGLPDKNRALLASQMMIWFSISDSADDDVDVRGCAGMDHLRRRHDLILACGTGKPGLNINMAGRAKYISREFSMLQDIWKDISKDMPLTMQSRYREAVGRYLHANQVQAQYRKAGSLPSVNEYLHVLRRPASISLQLLILMEYGLGIELDDETRSSELFLQLRNAVAGHIALYNDMFSYEAEICSGDFFNLPSVIFRAGVAAQPGFAFADAVLQAMRMAEEEDKRAAQLIDEVSKSKLIKKPGMADYLRSLGPFMGGNYDWSQNTGRYTHTCSKEALVHLLGSTLSLPSTASPPLPRIPAKAMQRITPVSPFTIHVHVPRLNFTHRLTTSTPLVIPLASVCLRKIV